MAFINNGNNKKFSVGKKNIQKQSISTPISISNNLKFLQFIFSSNTSVTRRSIINLYKYIKKINEEVAYQNNFTALYYFRFLKECCSLIVDKKLEVDIDNYYDVLSDYFNDNISENDIPDEVINECLNNISDLESKDLSNEDVIYLSHWIESRLSNSYIYEELDTLQSCINELKISDKINENVIKQFEDRIFELYKNIRTSKLNATFSGKDVSFNNKDSLMNTLDTTIKSCNSPSNKLKTGYKAFNKMINNGFESGRQYIFLGSQKSFKSGTLLNMALTICKNNPDYRPKDPTKRPMVVYFTMENDMKETMQRIFCYLTGSDDLSNFTTESAYELIDKEINQKCNISLRILFRPHKSVDTSFLYNILEDMELEGEECVCMIQDYIKRIRSTENIPDIRLELGEVVNEFSVFAKENKIPIITASQLNREATRIIENMKSSNKSDYAKVLGSSYIGESNLINENLDYGIIVNKEYNKDNNTTYVSFKLTASRAKHDDEDNLGYYFAQPMENGMKIEEDIDYDECIAVENIGGGLNTGDKKPVTMDDLKKRFENSKNTSTKKQNITDNNIMDDVSF